MKRLLIIILFIISWHAYGHEQKKLTLLLDWTPNTNHTGVYVAQEKGWYKDAGIDLRIVIPGETDVHKAVATESADLAISSQEAVTLARTQGIPIVSIAAIIQHNTSAFASKAEKNITSPSNFAGKRYGSFNSPIEKPMINALMNCVHTSADSVRIINTGWADFLSLVETDRIDFSWIFYGWAGIDAEIKGVNINRIMLRDYADCVPDYYTPVIISSEQAIENNADALAAFITASARGYEFAIDNPVESASILLKHNKDLSPELVYKSQEWLAKEYRSDAKQWGWQEAKVWKAYADFLIDNTIISSFDSQAAFTNSFMAK